MKQEEDSSININEKSKLVEADVFNDFSPIDELQLMVDVDNKADYEQVDMVLKKILVYPNDKLKEMHVDAMRLGNFDIQHKKQNQSKDNQLLKNQKPRPCPCCGFSIQKDNIKICTSMDEIKNIGSSTFLYLQSLKYLSILIGALFILYGLYAIGTNIAAAQRFTTQNIRYPYNTSNPQNYTKLTLKIALSAKIANPTDQNRLFYFIQCWIGVGVVFVWIILFTIIKYVENKQLRNYDKDSVNISDYSVVMEDCPLDITKEELQDNLNRYYDDLIRTKDIPQVHRQPFKIVKMNIGTPFYLLDDAVQDKKMEELQQQIAKTKLQIIDLIIDRQHNPKFTRPEAQRKALYKKYDEIRLQRAALYKSQAKKVTEKLKQEKGDSKTDIFVTFETSGANDLMVKYNQVTIFSRIRGICEQVNRFMLQREGKYFSMNIGKAPQPEDIRWNNIGRNDCSMLCRKLFTYFVTLLLLGASFAAVLGLSRAQDQAKNNAILGFVISITIVVINVTLGQVIRFLTLFQKDYTETNRQTSLAIKSIIAQSLNSIMVPVIVSFYIKREDKNYSNIYATGGLAENIFLLGLTNSFLPPILVLFDPYILFVKAKQCLKSRSKSKLYQSQKQHNQICQGIEFEVGYEYIYVVNVFLFVCFFVSLQPIVCVFGILGYMFNYWVQKYCLFYRYRRPTPGSDFINRAVYQLIFLGPLLFSLGNITWSNLDTISGNPQANPYKPLIPNLVAISLSAILLFVPINTIIIGCFFEDQDQKKCKYIDERIYFPSQYDRLNPATSEEGCKDYQAFLKEKEKDIKKLSKQEQQNMIGKMIRNQQRGQLQQQAVRQQPTFIGSNQNSFNPQMGPMFMPQPQQQFVNDFFGSAMFNRNMSSGNYGSFGSQSNIFGGYGGYGGYGGNMMQPQPAFMHPQPYPVANRPAPPMNYGAQQPGYNPLGMMLGRQY